MAITYTEFDTTPAGLTAALKAAILTNSHWSDQGVVNLTPTSTGATTTAGATVTLTSAAGFVIGGYLLANPGGANENTFLITNIVGNVITISGTWGVIYASGTTFKTKHTVLRSTSDRGVDLIVDLDHGNVTTTYLGVQTYRQYSGTAPGAQVDPKTFFTFWRATGGTTTQALHVVLSVGKNHLFFSIEGPRANETGTYNTTYGSLRNYFAISDLIPYHAADTIPAAIAIGNASGSVGPSVQGSNSHNVYISRDSANTKSWAPGRLASLDFPTIYTTDVVTMNRTCTIDGNTYLLPYVMFSEDEGIRGRLSSFFYCGTSANQTLMTDFPEPVGSKVTYSGIIYKLLMVNKGDGTNAVWGPFGSVANATTVTRSIVVAVPYAVAA